MGDRGRIEELLERYQAAVHAKDVDAFVALYDQDARVFGLWERWACRGTGEWRGWRPSGLARRAATVPDG